MLASKKSFGLFLAGTVLFITAALLFGANGIALAHGKTTVGDYELTIGFHTEPTVQGDLNSLDLFVVNTKTNEKVNGLEKTLKAEIIFGSFKKEVELYPQEDQDGAYGADVILTRVGDYTWHITGKINDTPVDVSMTSGPDTFDSVAPRSELSFPDAEPSSADLQAQANTALYVGIGGAVLGLVGIVLGFVGIRTARMSKS